MTEDIERKDDLPLSAYIDGALDEKETREIEARLKVEPALAARLEALRAANAGFRRDSQSIDEIPMSDGLTSLLDRLKKEDGDAPTEAPQEAPSNVVAFPFWRRAGRALEAHRAIAASIALLGAFAIAQTLMTGPAPQGWSGDGRIAASSDIAKALDEKLSGEEATLESGARFSARLSYRTGNGEFCRVFDLSRADRSSQNVACREGGGWRVAFSVATQRPPEASASEYETAASKTSEALERYLDDAIAGAPLTREGEAAAVAQDWKEQRR